METYLSGAKEAWRVIHQGMPLTTDRKTPQAAIDAAVKAYPSIKISNQYWDNEALEFVPVSHLHTRKANPAPRKAKKNATVNVYEMYGTRGEYAADILYRGKLLKQFAGMDLAAIFRQVETWCTNQGYAIRLNDETRRKNPAPRKRAISRPSQVTKKAPTKRLVSRRKAAAKKPVKGYFPNPAPGKQHGYFVDIKREKSAKWVNISIFKIKNDALTFAQDLAKRETGKFHQIRVMAEFDRGR